jgi:hypothetical protein
MLALLSVMLWAIGLQALPQSTTNSNIQILVNYSKSSGNEDLAKSIAEALREEGYSALAQPDRGGPVNKNQFSYGHGGDAHVGTILRKVLPVLPPGPSRLSVFDEFFPGSEHDASGHAGYHIVLHLNKKVQ